MQSGAMSTFDATVSSQPQMAQFRDVVQAWRDPGTGQHGNFQFLGHGLSVGVHVGGCVTVWSASQLPAISRKLATRQA